jgi:acyl-CoA synthetase (AMP-forming)/AMP-acid ligase II
MTDFILAPIEGPALAEPAPALTLPHFIRRQARRWPGALALTDAAGEHALTYGGLDQQIGRCAAGLAAAGLQPGDTLVMCSANSPAWVVVALGAMAAGARVSGANPAYTAAELARQMRDAGARFVFTQPGLLSTVRQAAATADCRSIVVDTPAPGALSLAELLACTAAEPDVPQDPDALALLPYSAGTTGAPKGVMLSHRAVVSNLCQLRQAGTWGAHTVLLAFLPMFHAMGFALTTLAGLACGARIVTLPRFEPRAFLQALSTHRVTDAVVVPPVMQFLAAHPMVEGFDLGALRLVGSGGAPLSAATQARVAQRLGCACTQGYGMTEVTACLTVGLVGQDMRPGSVGRVLPGTQCRVVDPGTGLYQPRGRSGELWFRGPQLFRGYLGQAHATEATLTPDGWIRTGDIGHVDAEGFVFVTDRLKELIKVKGLQVAPAELEALLLTHPAVADAAVIARPDGRAGERPVAYLVARGAIDAAAVQAWIAERVAPHKQLADVVLVDTIPKTPSGKLLRRLLREHDAARLQAA